MEWIADWFPFTVEEIAYAFREVGALSDDAMRAATALSADIGRAAIEGQHAVAIFGPFLGRVASMSDDAARRVAEFEKENTPNPGFFWEPGPQPDPSFFQDSMNCLTIVEAIGPTLPGFLRCATSEDGVTVTLAAGKHVPMFARVVDQLGIPSETLTFHFHER
jgi:hypothetical protein